MNFWTDDPDPAPEAEPSLAWLLGTVFLLGILAGWVIGQFTKGG